MPTLFLNGVYFYWNDSKYQMVYDGRKIELAEAISVLDDPLQITNIDERFDYQEMRMITIGMSNKGRLLVVAWTEIDEENITIITAYKPSQKQIKEYNNV